MTAVNIFEELINYVKAMETKFFSLSARTVLAYEEKNRQGKTEEVSVGNIIEFINAGVGFNKYTKTKAKFTTTYKTSSFKF